LGIIWLIESPDEAVTYAGDLCANFPVRTIASLESLGSLLAIEGQFLPDLILFRCPEDTKVQNALNLVRCYSNAPVILISCDESYKISLDDRYVIFPERFEISMLFSIIRRLIRRDSMDEGSLVNQSRMHYKHLSLDKASQYLVSECGGIEEKLPSKEAGILQILMQSQGGCVTRERIVERVWQSVKVGPRTVDAHISRLRRRLSSAGVQIENIYGSGYLLK
jgi:DNA-binding response OmpR family regulator